MTTTQHRGSGGVEQTGAVRDVEQPPADPQGVHDAHIHHDHIGHGSTPAAWAVSLTLIVGSVIAGIGFVTEIWALAYIGAASVPLSLALGWALKKAGYGVELDSWSVLQKGEDPRHHQGPVLAGDSSSSGATAPRSAGR